MKPTIQLAATRIPDGREMALFQHDGNFSIKINTLELMNSRQHESELELARLGCASLIGQATPRVLIGGLGLGYTLMQALTMLDADAEVIVSELLEPVVAWNREFLGDINNHALEDKRTVLQVGDVVELIAHSQNRFDAILLDVDNGPGAFSDPGNKRLYGRKGLRACKRALRDSGCLAVWSSEPDKAFEQLLMHAGFHVRRYRVAAYKGAKSNNRFVWLASEDESIFPPGGGEPVIPAKRSNSTAPRARKSTRRGRVG